MALCGLYEPENPLWTNRNIAAVWGNREYVITSI
jgi:hypothetical protein